MKKIYSFFYFIFISILLFGESDTIKLTIQISPFNSYYNRQASQIYNSFDLFLSPSMTQSLDIASSTYNFIFYLLDKNKWNIIQNPKYKHLAQTIAFYTGIIGLTYFPFGDSWLHEEFHRSILTYHKIQSYNQVYNFPIFSELISVNNVRDSDLIRFKAESPYDFVRLHEAGIEGEYLLINRLNQFSFFYNQPYPYFISNILITLNTISYVWLCHTEKAEEITNELNQNEKTILERDFTGLDFTAWVYDLFRPYESYVQRGVHPSGIGINRYIKPSNLNNEEINYLKTQGYMQILNIISPFTIGINKINIGSLKYNFAFRYYLSSFGTDIAFYNYFKVNKLNLIIAPHFYKNYNKLFTGFELEVFDLTFFSNKVLLNSNFQLFSQPKDLYFFANTKFLGYSIKANLNVEIYKNLYLQLGLINKSRGWVAGIVFQDKIFSFYSGISLRFYQ